jgi:phosphomannomutase/phosphoglucomutase
VRESLTLGTVTLPAVIFREYDIRGTVGDQLTADAAYAIGVAFARWATARLGRAPRIAVGRDNRPSGTELAPALGRGLRAAGAAVTDVGVVPTPALYFATHTIAVDGGMQVTGSHNPPAFNGFKMVLGGEPVCGPDIQALRELAAQAPGAARPGSSREETGLLGRYRDAIVARNAPLARTVRAVVDCGNGVTSLVAIDTLRRLGADIVPLFAESDGTFPNHHPDPTVPENLRDLQTVVRREGAELGIAFDGDGDRIGAVDETGRIIAGDELLILFGRDLAYRRGAGDPVIFDVKCSEVLPQELERVGLKPVMWRTGHSLIKQRMKELEAPLAGEMSGHMFFGGDWYGFDDALFAAARLLQALARQPGPLSALLGTLPATAATPEIRIECPAERKFAVVAQAAEHFGARYPVSRLDGARIRFAHGWGLLRASNTQPVLVLRFEAPSANALARNRDEVESWLRGVGVSV